MILIIHFNPRKSIFHKHGRKVSKYLIEVKYDDANKKDFIDISDYNTDETIEQAPSEIHERIKNDEDPLKIFKTKLPTIIKVIHL